MYSFPGLRGKHQSNPVKFSTMPDLPSDVCEHLLAKYMPPAIRKTKTLQQLFLRYVLRICACMVIIFRIFHLVVIHLFTLLLCTV